MMTAACPLCRQAVVAPPLNEVIAARRLNDHEASVLRAVWSGDGRHVQTNMIFDEIFADDIDGGPSPARMYEAFYKALHSLNSKLDGSGIAVRSAGCRKGWRIAFGMPS